MTESGEASVVPIALTVSGKTGYTVWAPPWVEDGDEWQAFLGAGGKVWLFEELADLEATLHSSVETDLSDHPGWPMLQTLPAEQLSPDLDYRFDLDAVPALTETDAEAEVVEQVTDALDMVERIAECCDNGTLLKLLEQPGFSELLGFEDDDEDEDEDEDEEDDEDEDDDEEDAGDEDAWAEIGAGIRTAWPGVLTKLAECVAWRTAEDLPEPAEDAEVDDEDEDAADEVDDEDEGGDAADVVFWNEVGIMPVELAMPSGIGYTLRCYVDDQARFLGTDLTVDIFRSKDALVTFCRTVDEHDLAALETWPDVREAEDLDVTPPAAERFDLTAVDAQLIGGPTVANVRLVRGAVDAIQDLADYCELAGVQAAFAADAPLGNTLAELYATSVGSSILPSYWSGEGAAAQWRTAVDEVDTCLRWHD